MNVQIDIRLRAAVGFDAEAEIWVAWCPALDIYSQEESATKAQAALKEALSLYVKHCYERRILDDVLNRKGFVPGTVGADSDLVAGDESDEYIEVRHNATITKQSGFSRRPRQTSRSCCRCAGKF